MTKIIENTENGVLTNFSVPDNLMDISADSIGPSMIGFPFTKVSFCQQRITSDKETPVKEVVAIINIPTSVLLEFMVTMQNSLKENAVRITPVLDQFKKHIS